MLLGVLRLPISCWQYSEIDKLQRHARYLDAADRIESDRAKLEVFDAFEEDAALEILKTYLQLHEGKVGMHWLWRAIERIVQGESEFDVLWDYGYVYSDEVIDVNEKEVIQ